MKQIFEDKMWGYLVSHPNWKHYGKSALTTFHWVRYAHGLTVRQAKILMLLQIRELGCNYEGGEECTKFRQMDRIEFINL